MITNGPWRAPDDDELSCVTGEEDPSGGPRIAGPIEPDSARQLSADDLAFFASWHEPKPRLRTRIWNAIREAFAAYPPPLA